MGASLIRRDLHDADDVCATACEMIFNNLGFSEMLKPLREVGVLVSEITAVSRRSRMEPAVNRTERRTYRRHPDRRVTFQAPRHRRTSSRRIIFYLLKGDLGYPGSTTDLII
jgi:hypothetical protein